MQIGIKQRRNCDFRDSLIVEVPKFHKIKYGKNTFSYFGPHIWNQIPADFKKEMDINVFKRLISTWNGPFCKCTSCDGNFY